MSPTRVAPLLLLLLPALAQDPPAEGASDAEPVAVELPVGDPSAVKIEVALGYGGKVPGQGFVPVAVDLTAPGGPHTVTVTFQAEEASHVLLRLGPVELAPGQRRRLHGVASADALQDAGEVLVSVESQGGGLLGRTRVEGEKVSGRMLLVLDKRGALPADFSGLRTREPSPHGGGSQVEVRWTAGILASGEDLPTSPLGWTGAGAVLLGDLDAPTWGEPEVRALSAWVHRGGHLLVSVGGRASALRRSMLARRLGAGVLPLRDQEPLREAPLQRTFKELAAAWGVEEGQGPVLAAPALAVLRPEPGDEVTFRDDLGRPLALRRRHGQGQITFVGVDLWREPFLHTSLTTHLVEALLTGGSRHFPRAQLLFPELAGVRQPARVGPAFAVLIVFALLAGPGVYFVLRGRKRGIWLWVAIPLLTAAFTGLVPLYRIVLKNAESTLVGVRLIEARQGEEQALETTDVLVFSGSLEEKRLELTGEDAVAFAMIPPRRINQGVPQLGQPLGGGPQGAAFGLPIALWGARYVSFESTGPTPPLTASVELHGERSALGTVRLEWKGDVPLDHVCVVYRGPTGAVFVHSVGRAVLPGESLEAKVEPLLASGYGVGKDLGALIMERLINGRYLSLIEQRGGAFVLASTEQGPRLRALPNVNVRQLPSVLAVEVPLQHRDAIPYGVLRTRVESRTVADVSSTTVEREVVTEVRLPPGTDARPLKQVGLRVAGSVLHPRSMVRVQLEAWRPDLGEWEKLALDAEENDPRRVSERELNLRFPSPPSAQAPQPDPARWIERQEGEGSRVRFRQRFTRSRREPDELHAVAVDLSLSWQLAPGTAPPEDD